MKLSLAGWSLQKRFRSTDNPLKLLDFPAFSKEKFGIDAVELNSPFFGSRSPKYLNELVAAAKKANVRLLNIAVDERGDLAAEDEAERTEGLAAYGAWIPIAKAIGCSAIRCNSGGKTIKNRDAAVASCIDSFRRLADDGRKNGVTILMENHGGISVDADTIVQIMESLRQSHGPDAVGTLPDFGNWPDNVDRYASLAKIMPYAKAVHAKVNDIDAQLNHPRFDHARCIRIARESGYNGYLGIEYEGSGEPIEGVKRAVKKLTPLIS
jgi:sugar phosphate isomerase/epimerase